MITIELENTLKKSLLEDGITLFLGSGFSVLANDQEGNRLPSGNELTQELANVFNLPNNLSLSRICTILERENKTEFKSYLKKRFIVNEFERLYYCILFLNLKSIFTTNIDNLVYKIFDYSKDSYLNDITFHGPSYGDKKAIDYIPLHGTIINDDHPLIFSTLNIYSAFTNDRDTWQYLRQAVQKNNCLFWGYSFEDAGVIEALFPGHDKKLHHKTKWIILPKEDEANIKYFKSLDFNIIVSDTKSMLSYISGLPVKQPPSDRKKPTQVLFPQESIPSVSSISVRPLIDFYLGAPPIWSDIFSDRIYKTSHCEKIVDLIYSERNVVVLGAPACGKTTIMMQVASGISFNGHKLVCDSITKEKAKLILKRVDDGDKVLIFIDNLADNIEALQILANSKKVQIVAYEREYNFEIVSHKLNREMFVFYNATELYDKDYQEIFSRIPETARKYKMSKLRGDSIPSLFEFVNLNIQKPHINERFKSVIRDLELKSEMMADFFVMSCYVSACRSLVSFDMALSFLGEDINDYKEVYKIKDKLGSLIVDYKGSIVEMEQDYFEPRSNFVSEAILEQVPGYLLKRVLKRFHDNVSIMRIYRYDTFRKRAYDSHYTKKAFDNWEEGKEFYKMLYEKRDSSPYILQQGALYLAAKRKFKDAFAWIDEALIESRNKIFSIRNSHAVILFEANINSDSQSVKETLDSSMHILNECYLDDKRKIYHATKYSEHALLYHDKYNDDISMSYLEKAHMWLDEEQKSNPWNREIRTLNKKVTHVLSKQ